MDVYEKQTEPYSGEALSGRLEQVVAVLVLPPLAREVLAYDADEILAKIYWPQSGVYDRPGQPGHGGGFRLLSIIGTDKNNTIRDFLSRRSDLRNVLYVEYGKLWVHWDSWRSGRLEDFFQTRIPSTVVTSLRDVIAGTITPFSYPDLFASATLKNTPQAIQHARDIYHPSDYDRVPVAVVYPLRSIHDLTIAPVTCELRWLDLDRYLASTPRIKRHNVFFAMPI